MNPCDSLITFLAASTIVTNVKLYLKDKKI